MPIRHLLCSILLSLVQLLHAGTTCGGHGDKTTLLVTTEWLAGHLKGPKLIILASGFKADYDAGHIPGSLFLDPSLFRQTPSAQLELPRVDELKRPFESLGISNDSHLVIYNLSNRAVAGAFRFYRNLDAIGLGSQTSVLDGGQPVWQSERRPLSTEIPATPKSGHLTDCAQSDVIADLDYVKSSLHKPGIALLDVREATSYAGASTMNKMRAGHIPGARLLPFEELLDDQNRFKSREAMEALFKSAGVKTGDQVVAYCWVGFRASVVYFAARYLGYDARLYLGSWTQWSQHSELPVETSINK